MNTDNTHNCLSPNKLLNKTKSNIEKYGLQVVGIEATSYLPSFSYSVGLYESYQHPEIICFGLPMNLAHEIINDVADLIKNGQRIIPNQDYNDKIFKESRAQFLLLDIRNLKDYFYAAFNYYQHYNFSALQLVWTDRHDHFPWEEGFEEQFTYDQPLLDRNADFKFYEPKNLGVFTTRQWLENNQPILRVVHDHDGNWQFLTGDQVLEDIKRVHFEELISSDLSLNEVFNLEYGQSAERNFIGDTWVISNCDIEGNESNENV